MTDKPETLLVRFDAGNKAKLEDYRAASGLRSLNEAVNRLIGASQITGADVMMIEQAAQAREAFRRRIEAADVLMAELERNPRLADVPGVQLGPTPSAPGSRLKQPKGKKP